MDKNTVFNMSRCKEEKGRLSKEVEKLLRDSLARSTNVVGWWPHGYDGTVRGPFFRWFKCAEVSPEYEKNVASVEDDTEYCAMSMNAVPILLNEIDALRRENEKSNSVTDPTLGNEILEALQAVRRMRSTPVVDDDFEEIRDKADYLLMKVLSQLEANKNA